MNDGAGSAVPFDLDAVGALSGTDKSSSVAWSWDYLRHYQTYFAPFRDQPINFIEIGVAGGPSLNVWTSFFSRAHIIGVDIEPACRRLARDRVTIEIGSQYDGDFLRDLCAKYPPSIVIDDGSHQAHHMVFTFETVFPALLPGGLYVVEDTEFQFPPHGEIWQGDKSVSVATYFSDLARDRMARGLPSGAGLKGPAKEIAGQIDEIIFVGGTIILRKRAPRDTAAAISFARDYVAARPPHAGHYRNFAEFILRHDGDLDEACAAARRAMELGAANWHAFHTMVRVLERQGKLSEAIPIAEEAARLWPERVEPWQALARLHRTAGDLAAACAVLRRAVTQTDSATALYREMLDALDAAGDLQAGLEVANEAAAHFAGRPENLFFLGRAAAFRNRIETGQK